MKSRALRLAPIARRDVAQKLKAARQRVPFGTPDRRNWLILEALKECRRAAKEHEGTHRNAFFFAPHRAAKEKETAQYWSFLGSCIVHMAEYRHVAAPSGMPSDIERLCQAMGIKTPTELLPVRT